MGGIAVNTDMETEVNGLYAVGEATTGLHGANRLEGNALTEALVTGIIAAETICRSQIKQLKENHETNTGNIDYDILNHINFDNNKSELNTNTIKNGKNIWEKFVIIIWAPFEVKVS